MWVQRRSKRLANPLILGQGNESRKCGIGVEIIEPTPNFQSEKTGTTPVGSANVFNSLRHSVLALLYKF